MSVEHLAAVLHHSKATGTTKLVMVGIANHDGGGGAWPAVSTLAIYAGKSEREVRRCLTRLVAMGEVRIIPRAGRSNGYKTLVTCPVWCDKTPQHRDIRKRHKPQESLWITTPDVEVTPDVCVSPTPDVEVIPPLTPASAEPSMNHPLNTAPSVPTETTDRASEETRRAAAALARAALKEKAS